MKLSKKVTDFIVFDEGNIGRKAAVTTGAVLASSVLGTVLTAQTAQAGDHCDVDEVHSNGWCVYGHCETHEQHYQC